jgi:hypothetical protein
MTFSEPYDLELPSNLFPIISFNKFTRIIGIPKKKIFRVVEHIDKYYEPFLKVTGSKERAIDNPIGFLKEIQRNINKRILRHIGFPDFIIGGVKGRNPLDHPLLHIRKPIVITVDIKGCYPNITNKKVFDIWFKQLGCSSDVAHVATKLTTIGGHLPLGAPTSNCLANLAVFPCIKEVILLADRYGFKGSQYVDDSAFSGNSLNNKIITRIIQEFSRSGFSIKRSKIQVMKANKSQRITGKIVNKKISIPRRERDKIKSAVYELKKTSRDDYGFIKRYQSVKGRIDSVKKFHPNFAKKMEIELENL